MVQVPCVATRFSGMLDLWGGPIRSARSDMHTGSPHKPQSGGVNQHTLTRIPCKQPAITALTHAHHHCTQSLTVPHMHVPSTHQHWHCKISIITQTLPERADQPSPGVHLSIPPLHRHRQQLHCPAHKCTLGNAPTLSCDFRKGVHKPHRLLARAGTSQPSTAQTVMQHSPS